MFKRIKVGSKIALFVALLVFISMLVMSFLTYNFSKQFISQKYLDDLVAVNHSQSKELEKFYQLHNSIFDAVSQNQIIYKALQSIPFGEDLQFVKQWEEELSHVFTPYVNVAGVENVFITDAGGQSVFNYNNQTILSPRITLVDPSGFDYRLKKAGTVFGGVYENEGQHRINAYSLIKIQEESFYIHMQLDASKVLQAIEGTAALGETAETVLARNDKDKLIFIHKPKFKSVYTVASGVYYGKDESKGLQLATKGVKGVSEVLDYRGEKVIASWQAIPGLNWGIVSKLDSAEVNNKIDELLLKLLLTGLALVLFSFFFAFGLAKFLMQRLQYLNKILQYLSKGILPNEIEKRSEDEFGEMTETVEQVVESLKRTAEFAHQIGEGNYESDYKPLSGKDILGASLLGMRDNIKASDERDDDRNWIVSGVAEIGGILRQNENLEGIGDQLLEYITDRVGAIQGAFYVVDEESGQKLINLRACFAYQKKKYISSQFQMAEGLVGQAAIEKDIIFRTEIPEEFTQITTGLLGEQKPESLLIMPLITDEKVYGVLELAAFHKFTDRQINFVQEISVIIARTIFNIKVNERTIGLLNESRGMSQELQEKQEILRQNAEEMQATQEELQRTNSQLEEQIEEVNRGQKRTQMLLENASEVITIYEEDRTVRYVSPSVERILGYSLEEMGGTDLLYYVSKEDKERLKAAFEELVLNPHRPMSIQYRIEQQSGEELWVEATGNNHLSNPAIQGILINLRDITLRLKAEREERMRSKMQSLSENSLDLIARLDTDGQVFYINPTIKHLTGKPADSYLNQKLADTDIPELVLNGWLEVLEEVKLTKEKISKELDFPTDLGTRIMQLNAIPEFDDEECVESVLVVSHDITEQKQIEREINSKNKKITESINYARRIQGAILPNEEHIHKQLPESFIVYKARDVVSGDFPWYLEVNDQIFIAAVDCTGHGVPGALISLIGYFLLNDIVRSQGVSDPGLILDQLDQEVTKTLRQDQEGATGKDGMDIALCKIDKKSNTVEFAGAHRPLFWMREGELTEVKGNKFPIGGGRYRNQTNFDSHTIDLQSGDSIYFCSDGYIDQFGGEQNRKFGSRRLRQLITDIAPLEMEQQFEECSTVWEDWKGEQKQTDDMLLIGIKF